MFGLLSGVVVVFCVNYFALGSFSCVALIFLASGLFFGAAFFFLCCVFFGGLFYCVAFVTFRPSY